MTDRTPAHVHFAEQLQPGFSCLLSSGSDSVLHSKFLCYVSGSSSRIAQCSTSQALLPWRRPVEANHLVSLDCSLCGGLFMAHSSSVVTRKGKRTKLWNEDKFIILRRRMISMSSWTNIRACRSTCARSETAPHSTQIFPNPHLSVQLWVGKLSKSCQHFLNLLVKEKQLWQVNVLSPCMPLYGTLSLFRTSFAGCYAFPCVSLGCDVSTCKPYRGIPRQRQRRWV